MLVPIFIRHAFVEIEALFIFHVAVEVVLESRLHAVFVKFRVSHYTHHHQHGNHKEQYIIYTQSPAPHLRRERLDLFFPG